MASETTIRHPSTPDALCAYIASAGRTVTTKQMEAYTCLMHHRGAEMARQALCVLVAQGRIVRVRRGVYRGANGTLK